MDEQNPVNWGALAYLCAKRTEKLPGRLTQFETCLKLAIQYGLNDSFLLGNIAKEYFRILLLGDSNDVSILLQCYSLAAESLKSRGNDIEDLITSITETVDFYKSNTPNKAKKLDDIRNKIIHRLSP
jgi:hypothetical protein